MSTKVNYQLGLDLIRKINQAADISKINYILANDSWHLFRQFQTVVLSINSIEQYKVSTISSLIEPKGQSSFTLWVEKLTKELIDKKLLENDYLQITKEESSGFVGEHWGDYWPEFILAVPFFDASKKCFQILILTREEIFKEEEISFVKTLVDVSSNKYFSLKQKFKQKFKLTKKMKQIILALFIVGLIPTKMSVNAPGEIISLKSKVVSAPIEGIIKEFKVRPNEFAKKGEVLFYLDSGMLSSKLDIAKSEYDSAYAEYITAQQKALIDVDSRAAVAMLEAKVLEKRSELKQAEKSLDYSSVKADEDGYFIYTDENDWLGKPVNAGEKIGQIAGKESLGVKIYLPADNAVELKPGDEISVSLNVAPLSTISGKLETVSFSSSLSPDNIVSYKLRAKIEENNNAKIGYRANVRIFGNRYPIIYQILRRPIGVVRSWLGI